MGQYPSTDLWWRLRERGYDISHLMRPINQITHPTMSTEKKVEMLRRNLKADKNRCPNVRSNMIYPTRTEDMTELEE